MGSASKRRIALVCLILILYLGSVNPHGVAGFSGQDRPAPVPPSALMHFQRGECEAAVTEITEYLKSAQASSAALAMLGTCLSNLQRFGDAESALRQSLRLEPKQPQALVQIGWVYYKLGRFGESDEALQQALSMNPTGADAYYVLAHLREAQRNYSDCAEAAQKSLDLMSPRRSLTAVRLAGSCLLELNRLKEAEAIVAPVASGVEMRYLLAKIKFNQGDYTASIRLLRDVLQERPGTSSAELLLGLSLMQSGQYDDAEAAYRSTLKRVGQSAEPPDFPLERLYEGIGQLMVILNRLSEADDFFTRALKANPAYVPALLGRARTLHRLHQSYRARRDAEKALELDAQSETAHALLLQIYLSLNLEQKAKGMADWLDARNRALVTGEGQRK